MTHVQRVCDFQMNFIVVLNTPRRNYLLKGRVRESYFSPLGSQDWVMWSQGQLKVRLVGKVSQWAQMDI